MKIYDSYSKQLIDINEDNINIYNCGPTVYNHIHVGNARPLIVFDVLHRYLKAISKNVCFVHNLTDIDDKIINRAIEEKSDEKTVSEKYIDAYTDIRKKLNTIELITPKITDNIDGIIDYVNRLIKIGAAYSINGNVYFDISFTNDYGILSNKRIDELVNGERVNIDDNKKNPGDFVLWKKTNVGIQWDTPWAKGRPGWHNECSYLIEKYFGNNLTIHGGGVDLKFPHHENENAQNQALHNHVLAKVWMHIGHVNINNQKMSKSLNNFILVKDILEKYNYQTIRWFFYGTNYSNPLNYSNENIENAKNDIERIKKSINYSKTILIMNNQYQINDKILDQEFLNELDNNLNIVNAITCIQKKLRELNIEIRNKNFIKSNELLNIITNCLTILGIEFDNIHNLENMQLIESYVKALNDKNFEESDAIRKQLIEKGLM